MHNNDSLSDLLIAELADLMDAEDQLMRALPNITRAAASDNLKSIMEGHRQTTHTHMNRLKNIFNDVGQNPRGVTSKTMKGLIAEIEHIIDTTPRGPVCDAAIVSVAQRIEHYEITGYGTAQEHADELGHTHIVDLLDKMLYETRTLHLNLSELAQERINAQATEGTSGAQS